MPDLCWLISVLPKLIFILPPSTCRHSLSSKRHYPNAVKNKAKNKYAYVGVDSCACICVHFDVCMGSTVFFFYKWVLLHVYTFQMNGSFVFLTLLHKCPVYHWSWVSQMGRRLNNSKKMGMVSLISLLRCHDMADKSAASFDPLVASSQVRMLP